MMTCRSCGEKIDQPFMDFGSLPLPNTFTEPDSIKKIQIYPLAVYFCPRCTLVQLKTQIDPKDIFTDTYKYFSSCSSDLLEQSKLLYENTVKDFHLTYESRIIEIASNDGYLLNFFKKGGHENILGVEPTQSTAQKALEKGIPTEICFFDETTAKRLADKEKADIVIANNVIAHVPDINGFVKGISLLLKDSGTAIIEFQYIRDLILMRLFDLMYHEHYSYFSLNSVNMLMNRNGLKIFKVEKTSSQGGSLRIFCVKSDEDVNTEESFKECINEEKSAKLHEMNTYLMFAEEVEANREKYIKTLKELKKAGFRIPAYGASAKGSIFLNYLGIDSSIIDFIADKNENKQNMILAGSGIPVYSPEKFKLHKPDLILILSWNLKDEIISQNKGLKFFTLLPEPEGLPMNYL